MMLLFTGGHKIRDSNAQLAGDTPDPSNFEQVISGDYGEMQFTHNAQTVWGAISGSVVHCL